MTESRYFYRKLRGILLPKRSLLRSGSLRSILLPKRSFLLPGNLRSILFFLALVFLSSCYSVRIVNKDGIPEPDPLNNSGNFYKGKKVHVLDTTISLKLVEGEFHLIERCATGGFYSFEYRVTFGGVLLSAVTFGKKRRVKIKYVCLKEQN